MTSVKVTVSGETLHCISPVKFLVLAFKVIKLLSFNSPFSLNGIIYLSAVNSKVVASLPFNANVYENVLLNSTPSTVMGTFNVPEGVFILVATLTVNLEAVVPLLRCAGIVIPIGIPVISPIVAGTLSVPL